MVVIKHILHSLGLLATLPLLQAKIVDDTINCNGSSRCSSFPNTSLPNFIPLTDQLDPNYVYGPGEDIMCSRNWALQSGVCVFPEKTSIKGSEVKGFLEQIRDYGCGKCGAVSTDAAGGVNAYDSALKVDYKSSLTDCEGVCIKQRKRDSNAINCNGSVRCDAEVDDEHLPPIKAMRELADLIKSDRVYSPDENILCKIAPLGTGICAFPNQVEISGHEVASYLDQLIDYGCQRCGSVSTDRENDVSVKEGSLKVDYKGGTSSCNGVCA